MATGQGPALLNGKLSEGDLSTLREALHCIRHKYEDLGMQIGVDSRDIDAIKHDTDRDSGIRLREVLKLRLRQSQALTWGDIDKALRSNTINEPRLADTILEQCRVRSEEQSSLRQEDGGSSSSSDESSSDCDDILKNLSETENKGLRKMFKKYFGRLCRDIKNPADIAAELQAKGLIKHSLIKELLLSPESDQAKTIKLVENIQKKIKQHPSYVFRVIELLLQREALRELGTEMKLATGKVCPEKTATYFNGSRSPPKEQSVIVGAMDSSSEGRYSLAASVSPLEMTPALAIFKKYLQSVYQARECHPVDKYLPTLKSPYINLAMISRASHDQGDRDEFTRQTLHGGVDQILQHKVPISMEELLTATESESEFIGVNSKGPMLDSLHAEEEYSQAMIIRDTDYHEEERAYKLRKRKIPLGVEDLLVKKKTKSDTNFTWMDPELESLYTDVSEDMQTEINTESQHIVIRENSQSPEHSELTESLYMGDSEVIQTEINAKSELMVTRENSKGPEHSDTTESLHTGDSYRKEKEKKPAKFVLVEGPPGIGKTTFTLELCRRWEDIESLKQFLIILLLKLRERWVLNATSLADLFRYEHDPELSKIIAREISDPNIQRRILLVLDGFDEVSHSFHEDSVVKRILRRELLPECTIILTTRPSARATLERVCQPRIGKHVEIIGFTEEERVRFIVEVFSKEPELQVNFLKYMFFVPHIKSMMYIPLNCAIIAQVYYESQSSCRHLFAIPKTKTQLYNALTHSFLVRHMETRECRREYTSMLPEGLDEEDMEKFKILANFAYDSHHMKSKKVTFFQEDIPEGLVHFGMMNESTEMYASKGVEKLFSFLHITIQEYLAAWHIAHCYSTENQVLYHHLALGAKVFLNEQQLLQDKLEKSPFQGQSLDQQIESLAEPAMFLAGITGWQDQPERGKKHWEMYLTDDIKEDVNNYCINPNLLLRSIYEAQNHELPSHYFIHEKRRNITISSMSNQTPYDCYALSYCLAHSSHQFELFIDIADENKLETFVKGVNNHCASTTPSITTLTLLHLEESAKYFDRCLFWLTKMSLSNTLETLVVHYYSSETPLAQDFIKSLTNLKSLRVSGSNLWTVSLDWLPALRYLTKLSKFDVDLHVTDGIPPSNGFECLPKEYNLTAMVLDVKLPTQYSKSLILIQQMQQLAPF